MTGPFFARRTDWVRTRIAPFSGLIIGLLGILGTNALIVFGIAPENRNAMILVTLTIALIILLGLRPKFRLVIAFYLHWPIVRQIFQTDSPALTDSH